MDGNEIQVSVTANENYAVDTLYVNGEKIAGDLNIYAYKMFNATAPAL